MPSLQPLSAQRVVLSEDPLTLALSEALNLLNDLHLHWLHPFKLSSKRVDPDQELMSVKDVGINSPVGSSDLDLVCFDWRSRSAGVISWRSSGKEADSMASDSALNGSDWSVGRRPGIGPQQTIILTTQYTQHSTMQRNAIQHAFIACGIKHNS